MSDWTPVHHEDAPEDPAPAERATAQRTPAKAARAETGERSGGSMPLKMAVDVPPDLFAALRTVVERQNDLMDRLDNLADNVEELVNLFKSQIK